MQKFFNILLVIMCVIVGMAWFNGVFTTRNGDLLTWINGDAIDRSRLITVQREQCPNAPFVLPSDGFVGLFYGDPRFPYNQARKHQGIDIFTNQPIGTVPVYAAYDGWVTRASYWASALIQRIDDPLNPGETLWLYYTHMADEDGNDFIEDVFPLGASNLFVEQGTLLGYIGNYDGNKPTKIWPHLHFSMVRDDGSGMYLNEMVFDNTVDPSPYFKMGVAYDLADSSPIACQSS